MKFNKQINNGTLLIPGGAFKISGFEGGEKVEIHTLDSAVVVLIILFIILFLTIDNL